MKKFTRQLTVATSAVVVAGTLSLSFAFGQVEVIVPVQPPAARVEVVPTIPAGRVWQPGYWRYEHNKYDWREGRIAEPPKPGATWAPGKWEKRGSGWIYMEGRWN